MILTEAGRIALDHAERIFDVGDDLVATLWAGGEATAAAAGRRAVDAVAQLPAPLPAAGPRGETSSWSCRSGNSQTLLAALEDLALDVVLLTDPPPRDVFPDLVAHRIAEQPVGLHGTPRRLRTRTLARTAGRRSR